MPDIENPFLDPPKKSPGEKEVEAGGYLVMIFRLLHIRMIYRKDVEAVQRTGELIKRWWRNLTLRS